ncbi:MAG: restriction endonuclease subunit S [Devosia sp.]
MKAGWTQTKLGDVVTLNYGRALAKSDRNPSGPVPVYGANGVMDWTDAQLSEGPSLVVGRKGSAGEITRVQGPFWPSDVTYFTSHDPRRLDFDFLHYALRTLNLPSLARGVKPGINRNDVYALGIHLPPLEEQQRIVAVLDEAFEGLARAGAHAEANLQNARELFASYLAKVLDANASDWPSTSVGSLVAEGCLFKPQDGNHGEIHPKKADFVPDGVPFIMASDLVDGHVDQTSCNFLRREHADSLRIGFAKNGDVLLSHKGTIGRTALLGSGPIKGDAPEVHRSDSVSARKNASLGDLA